MGGTKSGLTVVALVAAVGFVLLSSASCGGGDGSEAQPRDHAQVDACLRQSAVVDVDARSTPGDESTEGEDSYDWDFPPFSFSQAPGGWITVDMGEEQGAAIMFYSTALEAERVMDSMTFAFESPTQVGSVVYGFDEEPTDEERETIRRCVEA